MKKYTDPEIRAHPSPDSHGRVHCAVCGHFTASADQVHGWCRQRISPTKYLDDLREAFSAE